MVVILLSKISLIVKLATNVPMNVKFFIDCKIYVTLSEMTIFQLAYKLKRSGEIKVLHNKTKY